MKLDSIFEKIDSSISTTVEEIQQFIRVPTIVYDAEQIRRGAEFLREYLVKFGCSKVDLLQTPGAPIVYGEYNARSAITLIIYLWYDTDKLMDEWMVPPFEGRIIDLPSIGKSVIGRGAFTKGSLVAFIRAMDALRASDELPVNLKFVLEGDENLVSPNLPYFVERYGDLVKGSDGVLFPRVGQDKTGKVAMKLGGKGLLQMRLTCSGESWGHGPTKTDIHGSEKAWVDSPIWRLIKALSKLVSEDGNKVLIRGFYDNVVMPTKNQLKLVDSLLGSFDEESHKKELGVQRFVDDLHGRNLLLQYLFQPAFNLQGIDSGGGGIILPKSATAQIEVRFVPNQSADEILDKTRWHLVNEGYQDIKVDAKPGIDWSIVNPESGIVQSIVTSYESFGVKYDFWPMDVKSPPHGIFSTKLGIPVADGGLGHGGRHHASNEYILIRSNGSTGDLHLAEKSFVTIVNNFSERLQTQTRS